MFSKACEYGIRATMYIALESLVEKRVSLKEIVKEVGTPKAYTAKILKQLAKKNILDSKKGPRGGFLIKKTRIDQIKLGDIVFAIDGDSIYEACGLGLEECNADQPCPLHENFIIVRNELRQMLQNISLYELATGLELGLTWLKRKKIVSYIR